MCMDGHINIRIEKFSGHLSVVRLSGHLFIASKTVYSLLI